MMSCFGPSRNEMGVQGLWCYMGMSAAGDASPLPQSRRHSGGSPSGWGPLPMEYKAECDMHHKMGRKEAEWTALVDDGGGEGGVSLRCSPDIPQELCPPDSMSLV